MIPLEGIIAPLNREDEYVVDKEPLISVANVHIFSTFDITMKNIFIILFVALFASCKSGKIIFKPKPVVVTDLCGVRYPPNYKPLVYNDTMINTVNKFARGSGIDKTAPVTIYEEFDYAFYNFFGKDTVKCWKYIDSLQAHSVILCAKDGITVVYSRANTKLWAVPDPYTGNNIGNQLDSFGVYMTALKPKADKYRLNQMRNTSGGGVSWIGNLCQPHKYKCSVTTLHGNTTGWPIYDWDDEVRWHEGGHGDGSQHTHNPSWNGNGGKIDDCAGYVGYGEGSTVGVSQPNLRDCTINVDSAKTKCWLPYPEVGGTGMSYCHLTEGTIKFANGMGFQPSTLMKYYIAISDNCLTYHSNCPVTTPISGNVTFTSTPSANGTGVDIYLTANPMPGGEPYSYVWTASFFPGGIWYDKRIQGITSWVKNPAKPIQFKVIIHSANPCYTDKTITVTP